MSLKTQMKRRFGKKATRRIYAAMPWVGGGLALLVANVIKRNTPRAFYEQDGRKASDSGEMNRSTSQAREVDRDLVNTRNRDGLLTDTRA